MNGNRSQAPHFPPALLGALAGAAALVLSLAAAAPASASTLGLSASDGVVGGQIHATAELLDSPDAGGVISFEVFGPGDGDCSGPALDPAPASVPVNGEGSYDSGSIAAPAAGSYRWSAHYTGDGVNPAAETLCAADSSTVAKATPSLAATASTATVGGPIHDEATLVGAFTPTGEVTFSVYAPGDSSCAAPLASGGAALVGSSARSADHTTGAAGDFRWIASYPGDANNEPASTVCGASGQTSAVAKAQPGLSGTATSAPAPGAPITDQVTLSGGFAPDGSIVFRAYGPGDPSCAGPVAYVSTVTVSGAGEYAPEGFAPGPGLYTWTATYGGDSDNATAELPCGSANQSSAVGTIGIALGAQAGGGTVGAPVAAVATISGGAVPGGQLVFSAFAPGDAGCSGAPVLRAAVAVAGNGAYSSPPLATTQVGIYRWVVEYTGDVNHASATAACGTASSPTTQALPTLVGAVKARGEVGRAVRDWAVLEGAYAPSGSVTFRIYGPVASGCAKPALVNSVAVSANGSIRSDPLVPLRPGRYSFTVSYSGDARNKPVATGCDAAGQVLVVAKRTPQVKPLAVVLGERRISIRALLKNAASPSGAVNFRLYRPDDKLCRKRPAFSGAITAKRNGTLTLATYIATARGEYRLVVGYSGDQRNKRLATACGRAQEIEIG